MSEVSTGGAPAATTSEGTSEVSNQQNDSAKPQASEGLTKAQKEKFKLLVDGQEIEEEIDFSDKEGLKKRFQLAHAAQKRMTEANDAKKKAFQITKEFEENPEAFLAKLGPKGREIAEKFLLSQIQDEMLSPEEKEFRDLKKYKEMTEAEKAKAKEDAEKAESEKLEAKYAQEFQKTIIEALDLTGMPKKPEAVKRMAYLMSKNMELGLDLTAKELAEEYKSEVKAYLQSLVGGAEGDQIVSLFGEDIAKKVRKFDMKALQESQSKLFQKPHVTSTTNTTNKEKGYQTIDEWKEQLNAKFSKK